MKLKMLAAACAAAAVSLLTPASAVHAQGKPAKVLKLAHGATENQAVGMAFLKFAELVKEKSGGTLAIETHLAGSLYNERTSIEAVLNGAVDLGGGSNANWGAFTRTLIFMDLPYVFKDEAAFEKAMAGQVGEEIRQRFERDGFKLLMLLNNGGFRHVVNTKKQLKVPGDLAGLKIRTTASPVEIAMFKNWGAIPTSVDWAEVYNALSSGVVDGEFVMPTWLATAKHYEVLKYATANDAVIGVQTLVMRKDRFAKLPAESQKAILEASREAEAYGNRIDHGMAAKALAYAESQGVKVYHPSAEEMTQWRTTGQQIWKQFEGQLDKTLFQQVLDAQK
ncbi:TRAP transporter substrate-binding protein [Bordetella bronchiseptica]